MWDSATLCLQAEQPNAHNENVTSVAYSPDGRTIVSCSDDMTIKTWESGTLSTPGSPVTLRSQRSRSSGLSDSAPEVPEPPQPTGSPLSPRSSANAPCAAKASEAAHAEATAADRTLRSPEQMISAAEEAKASAQAEFDQTSMWNPAAWGKRDELLAKIKEQEEIIRKAQAVGVAEASPREAALA